MGSLDRAATQGRAPKQDHTRIFFNFYFLKLKDPFYINRHV